MEPPQCVPEPEPGPQLSPATKHSGANLESRDLDGKMHSFSGGSGLDNVNSCFSVSVKPKIWYQLSYLEQDNVEVVQAENGILRRKLQSKTEGLMILSKEVDSLRNDLNQMKALNEHLMNPVRWLTCLQSVTDFKLFRKAQMRQLYNYLLKAKDSPLSLPENETEWSFTRSWGRKTIFFK